MKTIQEKYNAILEGKFSKTQFVRDAKRELPQFISPYNGFEDSISILKRRGMLTEMKLTGVQVYDDRVEPTYSLDTLERGIDYELEAMGLDSSRPKENVSEKDLEKVKKKVEKNLAKDPNYYLHLLSGDSKKVDKHDQMVPVGKNNHVDVFNGLKKAELNEAKKLLKEGKVEDLAKKLKVSDLVIGLTIVSIGTSFPELVVGLISAFQGYTDFVIGNVLGSNIANIGLAIGLPALFFKIDFDLKNSIAPFIYNLLACLMLYIFLQDNIINSKEAQGLLLVLSLIHI